MPNSSKIKDPRFWKRWRSSGAIGTITKVTQEDEIDENEIDWDMLNGKFDYAGTFSEGRIPVRRGNLWFHVFPDGRRAYSATIGFGKAGSYRKGRASVRSNGRPLLIDYSGMPVEEEEILN